MQHQNNFRSNNIQQPQQQQQQQQQNRNIQQQQQQQQQLQPIQPIQPIKKGYGVSNTSGIMSGNNGVMGVSSFRSNSTKTGPTMISGVPNKGSLISGKHVVSPLVQPRSPLVQKPPIQQLQQSPQQKSQLQLPQPQDNIISNNTPQPPSYHGSSTPINNNFNNDHHHSDAPFFVQTPSRNTTISQNHYNPHQSPIMQPQQQFMNDGNINMRQPQPPPIVNINNNFNNKPPINKPMAMPMSKPIISHKPQQPTYQQQYQPQKQQPQQQQQQIVAVLPNPSEQQQQQQQEPVLPTTPDSFDIENEINELDNNSGMTTMITTTASTSTSAAILPPPLHQPPQQTLKNVSNVPIGPIKTNVHNNNNLNNNNNNNNSNSNINPQPQSNDNNLYLQKQSELERTINQLKMDLERKDKELKDSQLTNQKTTEQLNKIKEQQLKTSTAVVQPSKSVEKRKPENELLSDSSKKIKSTTATVNKKPAEAVPTPQPPKIPKEKIIMDEIMEDISLLNPFEKPLKPTHNLGLQAITKQKAEMNKQTNHILKLLSFKNGSLPSIFYLLPTNYANSLSYPSSSSSNSLTNPFLSTSTPLLLQTNGGASGSTLPQLKQTSQNSKTSGVILNKQQTTTSQKQQLPPIVGSGSSSKITKQTSTTAAGTGTIQRSKSMTELVLLPPQFSEELAVCLSNILSLQRPSNSLFKKLLPFLKLSSPIAVEKSLDVILTLLTTCSDCVDFLISKLAYDSTSTFSPTNNIISSSSSQPTSTLISPPILTTAGTQHQPQSSSSSQLSKPHTLTLSNNQVITLYPLPNMLTNPRIFTLSPPPTIPTITENQQKQKEKQIKELQIIALSNHSSNNNSSSNKNINYMDIDSATTTIDSKKNIIREDVSILNYLIDNFNNLCNLSNSNNKIIDLTLTILLLITDKIIISTQQNNNHNSISNIIKNNSLLEKFENIFDYANINFIFSNQASIDQKILYVELADNLIINEDIMILLSGGLNGNDMESLVSSFIVKVIFTLSKPPSSTLNRAQRNKSKTLKLKIVKFLSKVVTIYKRKVDYLFRDYIFQAGVLLVYHEFNNGDLDLHLYKESQEQLQITTLLKETLRLIYCWCNKFTEEIVLKDSEKEFELLKATTLKISKYSHLVPLSELIELCEKLVEFLDTTNNQINTANPLSNNNNNKNNNNDGNVNNTSIDQTSDDTDNNINNNQTNNNNQTAISSNK